MRPFRAEFFYFKMLTHKSGPEPVLYMCVEQKTKLNISKIDLAKPSLWVIYLALYLNLNLRDDKIIRLSEAK